MVVLVAHVGKGVSDNVDVLIVVGSLSLKLVDDQRQIAYLTGLMVCIVALVGLGTPALIR